ncbi:MAG: Asp-tRNA(Asn)/Glu-tRNA(Gln) amidotransferase GatCAB subunit B, partial [Bacillota bacterium]|nr:Asp-tRNA(Asn)/Glu-tRNA(Gln) amidotransferase GatCAB subunit B [Bacillota bacterium]
DLAFEEIPVKQEHIVELAKLVAEGKISNTAAKEVFEEVFNTGKSPEAVVEEKGLSQISDTGALEEAVVSVLEANPQSVEDYKGGKLQAIGFLVGQVMKATKGKANPKMVKDLLEEKLK